VDFTLLGDVTVRHEDRFIALADIHRAVLAVLLYHLGRMVHREEFIRLIWGSPADAPQTVDELLVQYVSRLRKALSPAGGQHLQTIRKVGFELTIDPSTVDWHVFRRHLRDGRAAQNDGNVDLAAAELWQGLDLWRGEPLADIRPRLGPIRAEMENLRLEAAELLAGIELNRGNPEQVVNLLADLARNRPDRERLVAHLMRALSATGQRPAAIDAYQRSKGFVTTRLGLDPGSEIEEAFQELLHARQMRASTPTLAGGPAQLPRDTSHYTGRTAELEQLLLLLPQLAAAPAGAAPSGVGATTTTICAIDGMAGVGKTAFAIHAAHQFTPWFPDGQLFLNLHAYSESVPRVEPAEALERLLRAVGVDPSKIPRHLDDRSALYRDRLAGRRVLILLDNAYNADHVRPLIPAAGGCLVLITSRRRLTALDEAQPLSLDTLPTADAVALLGSVAGTARLHGARADAERIAELCGRLPLAIRIVAARLRGHAVWEPTRLAERLSDVRLQLSELDDGERSTTAAFTLSYRDLGQEQRRAFRLLGLVPGRDIDTYATAALIDAPLLRSSQLLHELLDAHLIGEQVEGRYVLHDLMRRFAAAQAEAEDPAEDRNQAIHRWLDHQLRMATAATNLLYPHSESVQVQSPERSQPVLPSANPPSPRSWLDLERPNLIAAAGHAVEYQRPDFAIKLDAVLYTYLLGGSHYADALRLHESALIAAEQSGARAAVGISLGHLGNTCRPLGRWEDALDYLRSALIVHEEIGDRGQQAITLGTIGMVLGQHGRYRRALGYLEQALVLHREIDDGAHEGETLAAIGNVYFYLGEFEEQVDCYQQAVQIFTRTGDRVGAAGVLCNLGTVLESRGRYDDASTQFRQAIDIFADAGDRAREATALSNLGEVHRRQGNAEVALIEHGRALAILREIENRPSEAGTLSYLASAHSALGHHEQSLSLFEDALTIARQVGDHTLEAEVHGRLGDACRASGEPIRALESYRSALELAVQIGNPYERARGLAGVGLLLEVDQPWPAHWHLRRALDDFTMLGVVEADEVTAHVDRYDR
jgi:tetratricopeptide (TPR) repeat protein